MHPVLIIDFNNMVHRARAGFSKGENSITYTFFLMIRKCVETFSPKQVYIVKEGRPVSRHEQLPEYKANRSSAGDDFWRQHGDILRILQNFPVHVVRHPLQECDDTIAHLARVIHKKDECVIVSTDTDFIQLLEDDKRVKLWNPTKKEWVEKFDCDYVMCKSLVGDACDNVSGFKGIGYKTARKLLQNPEALEEFLSQPGNREHFERNLSLIRFNKIEDELQKFPSVTNWDQVEKEFQDLNFSSMLNPKSWKKYVLTFELCE